MACCVQGFNSSTGYQQPFFTREGENTEQKGSEIRFHSHLCFSAVCDMRAWFAIRFGHTLG